MVKQAEAPLPLPPKACEDFERGRRDGMPEECAKAIAEFDKDKLNALHTPKKPFGKGRQSATSLIIGTIANRSNTLKS